MSGAELPVPSPPVVPETKPFWDGTKAGRLMLPRCPRCSFVIWYPRQFCPECGNTSVEWFEASGLGSIYSFTIVRRGEGAYRETPLYVLEPGVGVYIDEVYMPTLASSAIDLLDLERVEILRGPQGTLAGKNALGGAIKLFSKLPSNESTGFLEAGYGSDEEQRLRGAINLPLIADQLFVRLAASKHKQDGYVTRYDYGCLNPDSGIPATTNSSGCKLGEEGGFDHGGVRAAVRWLPTDALEINVSYDRTRVRDETSASILLEAINTQGQPYTDYGRFITDQRFVNYATFCVPELDYCIPPVSNNDDWGVATTIDYTFSPTVSVKSITGYRDYTSEFATDADNGPLTAQLLFNQLAFRSFTQELRLNATLDRFDWTLGGFYYRGRGSQGGRNPVNAPTNYLSGYTVSNARLSWLAPGSGHWQVTLAVTNLTDRYYFVRRDDLLNQIGTIVATPARPRTYFVSLRAQF